MPSFRCLLACIFTLTAWAEVPSSTLSGRWTGPGRFLNVRFQKTFGAVTFDLAISDDLILTGTVGGARILPCKPTARNGRQDYKAELEGVIRPEDAFRKRRLVLLVTHIEGSSLEADFHLKTNFLLDWSMRVGQLKATRH